MTVRVLADELVHVLAVGDGKTFKRWTWCGYDYNRDSMFETDEVPTCFACAVGRPAWPRPERCM